MSYCLGCLACQTACPAGVNYAQLFETARSDIERRGRHTGASRAVLALVDARRSLHESASPALAGRLMRFYQRSGLEASCAALA